jgi:hypothetical protein
MGGSGGSGGERLDARADAPRDVRPSDARPEIGVNAPVDAPTDRPGIDGLPGCSGAPAEGTGRGLRGEYYDTQDFKQLKFIRIDGSLNVDWAAGGPDLRHRDRHLSVRWTGQVQPRFTGLYTFYVLPTRACGCSSHGQMVIDHFMPHQSTEDSGTIMLHRGTEVRDQGGVLRGHGRGGDPARLVERVPAEGGDPAVAALPADACHVRPGNRRRGHWPARRVLRQSRTSPRSR